MQPNYPIALWPTRLLFSALIASLCGCALVNDKVTTLFSANVDAVGVVNERVFLGKASFAGEREATLQLQSSHDPRLTCFGTLRFSATSSGVIDLSCSDGRSTRLEFQALSRASGSGRGMMGKDEFGLTYGLPPEKAAGLLGLSADRLTPPKSLDGESE
jgi:hypothetical protein